MSQNSALALFDVTAVLTVGVCLAIPLRRLRQPTVTGEIFAGLALGPRARSRATHAGVLRRVRGLGWRRSSLRRGVPRPGRPPPTDSGISTPFCSVTTPVSAPISSLSCVTAAGTCQVFVHSRTKSTLPIFPGSAVACAGVTVKSPAMLSTVSPSRRSVARLSPRARNHTSWPPAARWPPK